MGYNLLSDSLILSSLVTKRDFIQRLDMDNQVYQISSDLFLVKEIEASVLHKV